MPVRRSLALATSLLLLASVLWAQTPSATSEDAARRFAGDPLFRHATVGLAVYDLTAHRSLASLNADKLFNAGSTTKLVTEGTALALLGPDYRFRTRVYHTGHITDDGTLEGDLVLVAGGDPNLSGRVLNGDHLDFTVHDHSYAGSLPGETVAGDPLRVLKSLATGVLMKGIWRIRGNIRVDDSLFPTGAIEPATHCTLSPVMVNDNVIDVTAIGAAQPGGSVSLRLSPDLGTLKIINHATTSATGDAALQFTAETVDADGTRNVVLEGTIPAGERALVAYKVRDPSRFAAEAFASALRWANVKLEEAPAGSTAEARPYSPETLLAEHLSPPLREEVRLTLKASQNLHAAVAPWLLGSLVAGAHGADAAQKGLTLEHKFLASAGLEVESVAQLDGEGGVGSAFSPQFLVNYLAFASRQSWGPGFIEALPVLGRDGTLAEMLEDSPAAGHVHAKTGSYVVANPLNQGVIVLSKGLAGYIDARNGHRLVFAVFVNLATAKDMDGVAAIGERLARFAETLYLQPAPNPRK